MNFVLKNSNALNGELFSLQRYFFFFKVCNEVELEFISEIDTKGYLSFNREREVINGLQLRSQASYLQRERMCDKL